ncbi:hypothetical protein CVT24_002576 [Panaeolus cyanescens]|uniref:Uncharacterized protein n=1 Tax=Panaeolus cyanescens TaxID=181874 RepID=A0A409YTZ0_9AGAR|nr:hypothetical protein CVT24_002576 [Panaeolus cyanescens]
MEPPNFPTLRKGTCGDANSAPMEPPNFPTLRKGTCGDANSSSDHQRLMSALRSIDFAVPFNLHEVLSRPVPFKGETFQRYASGYSLVFGKILEATSQESPPYSVSPPLVRESLESLHGYCLWLQRQFETMRLAQVHTQPYFEFVEKVKQNIEETLKQWFVISTDIEFFSDLAQSGIPALNGLDAEFTPFMEEFDNSPLPDPLPSLPAPRSNATPPKWTELNNLHRVFFDQLSSTSLVAWSGACRENYHSIAAYARITFQLHVTLSLFLSFDEVQSLRAIMKERRAVISGSAALHFFSRTVLQISSDLDLYAEYTQEAPIILFLLSLGFSEVNERGAADYSPQFLPAGRPVLVGVRTYKRNGASIQLILCSACPFEAILHFHSTVVMNVLSFNKAYSLYPSYTFGRQSGIVNRVAFIETGCIWKYEERGWSFYDSRPVNYNVTAARDGHRFVGDSMTWVQQIYPPLPNSSDSIDLIEVNTWGTESCFLHGQWRLRFNYTTVKYPVIKSAYTISEHRMSLTIGRLLLPGKLSSPPETADGYQDYRLRNIIRALYSLEI